MQPSKSPSATNGIWDRYGSAEFEHDELQHSFETSPSTRMSGPPDGGLREGTV
ncbi:MAG: hypothetical protein M3Q16_12400 [Pseudomonadota bacterium]|nr:hypothetical protein [Pseudomonadota bacterium]